MSITPSQQRVIKQSGLAYRDFLQSRPGARSETRLSDYSPSTEL